MQILKAGDVRKDGDEYRREWPDYSPGYMDPHREKMGEWNAVAPGMFGFPLLPADLMGATFRRAA